MALQRTGRRSRDIASARTVVDWDAELKGANA